MMRCVATLGVVLFAYFSIGVFAAEERVEVPVGKVFIPMQGFDDNDHVEAVVTGELPNPCFTLMETTLENKGGANFRVHQWASLSHEGNCGTGDLIDDPVPFTSVGQLGTLRSSSYSINFDKGWLGTGARSFNVSQAPSQDLDSFLYATVVSINMEDTYKETENIELTISGFLPGTSPHLITPVEVQVQGDVIVILPKVDGAAVGNKLIPFKQTVKLAKLKAGEYLIHARSRGGRAVYRHFWVVEK